MERSRETLRRPRLLVDEERARGNIQRMVDKARASGAALRPHFKTHQSREIGRWFRDAGVREVTVSSVDQALYFAADGWDDITIAIPVCPGDITRIDGLADTVRLGLLVDAPETVDLLGRELDALARVWIKVDVGYGRVGVRWDDPARVLDIARRIDRADGLEPAGLLTHAGHSYHSAGPAEIAEIHRQTVARMTGVADALDGAGLGRPALSVGDTPCCSVAPDFCGLDEIRPGNFVFYDAQQLALGACAEQDIALGLECPVIGVYPERREAVVLGGAVHLSKDRFSLPDGGEAFGWVVRRCDRSFGRVDRRVYVRGVSQEHGMIAIGDPDLLAELRPGDALTVLPAHSCLAANLHPAYATTNGRSILRLGAGETG